MYILQLGCYIFADMDTPQVLEMKELVRERILRLCRRIESGISSCRDISVEAENDIELILQLSQVSEQTDMPDVDK